MYTGEARLRREEIPASSNFAFVKGKRSEDAGLLYRRNSSGMGHQCGGNPFIGLASGKGKKRRG